ncbi:MAG TPA: acyltransferase [Wenzhouxiangellaceae bacterium]|nr:acyltransferase [Wenzhouxiangellaceae bacterium]
MNHPHPVGLPNRKFIPGLHALRGIAAMGVLLFHWNAFFPDLNLAFPGVDWAGIRWQPFRPINFGWLGVPLFFVLSGYLLGGKLLDKSLDSGTLTRYWSRRFLRIYPAAWLQLPILLLIAWWLPELMRFPDWGALLRNATLWIHLPPWMTKPLNGVWWTLPVELMFYIALPGIVLVNRRIGMAATVILAFAVTMAWRVAVIEYYGDTSYAGREFVTSALPGSLASFVLGMAINAVPRRLAQRQTFALLGLLLIAWLVLTEWLRVNLSTYWTGNWIFVVWDPAMYIVIAALVFVVLHGDRIAQALSARWLVWIGEISFGLYLWHFPVIQVLDHLLGSQLESPTGSLVALGICLGFTIPLAAVSYYLVERPAMGWGKRAFATAPSSGPCRATVR